MVALQLKTASFSIFSYLEQEARKKSVKQQKTPGCD